jgi:hypothetical protein
MGVNGLERFSVGKGWARDGLGEIKNPLAEKNRRTPESSGIGVAEAERDGAQALSGAPDR